MPITGLPRITLGQLPTPVEDMPRLSAALGGPTLLIKRDDQTGLATGGNKTRKLEFIIGRALEEGRDTLVTLGSVQSNHCRQTAAAAARYGLECIIVLKGHPPARWVGNLLLDDILGAKVVFARDEDRETVAERVTREAEASGRRPLLIPLGASNEVGALGFVSAMEELASQLDAAGLDLDRVFFASSSGGTQAGLCLGASVLGLAGRLEAISVDQERASLQEKVLGIASAAADMLGRGEKLDPADVVVHDDYRGEGYAVMGEAEKEAIRLVARTEGILLDPVYTGRAMAGMIDLIRRGELQESETILFWHTGGSAALHAYADDLTTEK